MPDEIKSITPDNEQFLTEGRFYGEMDDIEAKTYGRDTDKRKARSVSREYEESGGKTSHGTRGTRGAEASEPKTPPVRDKNVGFEQLEEIQSLFDDYSEEPYEPLEAIDTFHDLKNKFDEPISDALDAQEAREKAAEEADKNPEDGEVTTISDEDPGASWQYKYPPR